MKNKKKYIIIFIFLIYSQCVASIVHNSGEFDNRAKYIYNQGQVFITDSTIIFTHKQNAEISVDELIFHNINLSDIETDIIYKSTDYTYITSLNGKPHYITSKAIDSIIYYDIYPNTNLIISDKNNYFACSFSMAENTTLKDLPISMVKNKGANQKVIDNINEIDVFKEQATKKNKFNKLQSGTIVDFLIYSTYFGGSDFDIIRDTEIDESGNIYILGHTLSPDFFIKNAYDDSFEADEEDNYDIFLTKFDSTGQWVYFSTYIGTKFNEYGECLALDSNNNIYIGGTSKSYGLYPTTDDAAFSSVIGNYDGIISKISASGKTLLYSTLIGGNLDDYVQDIKVTPENILIAAGYTKSTKDFPITVNTYQANNAGGFDGWTAIFAANHTSLAFCSYLGGSENDFIQDMELSNNGMPIFAGFTYSPDFPQKSSNTLSNIQEKKCDIFISKFENSWTSLDFSLVMGGYEKDEVYAIEKDRLGKIHVVGNTSSRDFPIINSNLPNNQNNYDIAYGSCDVLHVIYDAEHDEIEYSNCFGGSAFDYGLDIFIDEKTNGINITGYTTSDNFPISEDAIQKTLIDTNDTSDLFVTRFSENGKTLNYSTYIGGSNNDVGHGILYNDFSEFIIVGRTESDDFPITKDAADITIDEKSQSEVFLLRFKPNNKEVYSLEDTIHICQRDTAFLAAYFSFADTTGNYTINWKPDSYLNRTDTTSVFAIPDKSLSYRAYLSDTLGVIDSCSIFVRVNPTPSTEIQGEYFVYPDSTQNYWVELLDNSFYKWEVDGGQIISGASTEIVSVKWDTNRINQIHLTALSEYGCGDTATINIFSAETPFTFNLDQTGEIKICKNDLLVLDAGDYSKYRWSDGNTSRFDTINRSGKYWCHAVNSSNIWGYSDTISIIVDTMPDIQLFGRFTVAKDDTLDYRILLDTNFTYEWLVVNGEILEGGGNEKSAKIHWYPDSAYGAIKIVVENTVSCIDTIQYDIMIGKDFPPILIVSDTITIICPGDSLILDANDGYTSYLWSSGNTSQVITIKQPGLYYCMVRDVYNRTLISDTVKVTMLMAPPTPTVVYNHYDKVLICLDDAFQYEWYLVQETGDSLIDSTQQFFYTIAGDYYLLVYNENGCFTRSADTTTVGIIENNVSDNIKIIPNPNYGYFELITEDIKFFNATISIYNSNGQLIKMIPNEDFSSHIKIDISEQVSGSYYLIIETEEQYFYKPIILVR